MECWRQIYLLAGVIKEDRLFFPFSFGPFIGFWAAFEGASRLGNFVIAGGGMSTSIRLQAMIENEATVVCCTPTYALRMAEVASEEGNRSQGIQYSHGNRRRRTGRRHTGDSRPPSNPRGMRASSITGA